jgi:hypothetical protein
MLLSSTTVAQAPATMTISLVALAPCASQTTFYAASPCTFELTIQMPANNATGMHVELFSTDNTSAVLAQISRPTIVMGANYNRSTAPLPVMVASLSPTQVCMQIDQILYQILSTQMPKMNVQFSGSH